MPSVLPDHFAGASARTIDAFRSYQASYIIIEMATAPHVEEISVLLGFSEEPPRCAAIYSPERLSLIVKEVREAAEGRPIFLKYDWQYAIDRVRGKSVLSQYREFLAFVARNYQSVEQQNCLIDAKLEGGSTH